MTALKLKKKYNYYFANNMNNQHLLDGFLETVFGKKKLNSFISKMITTIVSKIKKQLLLK